RNVCMHATRHLVLRIAGAAFAKRSGVRAGWCQQWVLPVMEALQVEVGPFLSALMAIVVIDIVLAGDNAIVIALAARQLPPHLQKKAIVWGALGAVGVRVVLTAAVVWLLRIPGLLAVGGALLVWIAWKLLQPDDAPDSTDAHAPVVTGFWSAMRTVIVADALMGLDNVLAVAGAAHGNML